MKTRRIAQLSALVLTMAGLSAIDVPRSWGGANTQRLASALTLATNPSPDDEEGRLLAGEIPPEVMRDFQQLWPSLSPGEIHQRWATGGGRAKLSEEFFADPAFAGVDYDFQANQFAVFATNPATVDRFVATAAAQGQKALGEVVQRNYVELQKIRDQAELVLVREKNYELSVNWRKNEVAAVVNPAGADLVRELEAIPGVRVTVSDSIPQGEPAACSSRYNCGGPLRGGVNFGRFVSGASLVGCSIGFTTTATDGSRWFYTAGHCISQAQVDAHVEYGHGVQPIGDARSTYNVGAVDVARVRNASSYWLTWGGGYLYNTLSSPSNVDYSILSATTIAYGDVVCFQAKSYVAGDDNCGVVTAQNITGKPQVTGIKVCGGDSGGSSYALIGAERWAYGLISVSSDRPYNDCTGNGTGQISFSSIPLINAYMDSVTAANVRVDAR